MYCCVYDVSFRTILLGASCLRVPYPNMAADDEANAATSTEPVVGSDQHRARRLRTEDVLADKSFEELAVPSDLVKALAQCGFDRPSPVQQTAIPLGRLGSDLIIQAKSGTGKTVVFATILLERVKLDVPHVQVRKADMVACCAKYARHGVLHPRPVPCSLAMHVWSHASACTP